MIRAIAFVVFAGAVVSTSLADSARPTNRSPLEILRSVDQANGVATVDLPRLPRDGVAGDPAVARAEFELVPSPFGPYTAGEIIDVDLWVHSLDDNSRELRLIMFDTTDTDPALALPATFSFDFTALSDGGATYFQDKTPPFLAVAYTGLSSVPGTMLVLPAHGSLHVGAFVGVTLPVFPGAFSVDVLNADDANPDHGAELRSGFGVLPGDPLVKWRASTGEIIGESLELIVGACVADIDCDDENTCDGVEVCVNGVCTAGVSPCDDGIDCTIDSCDAGGNCTHRQNHAMCDDGLFCNGKEVCNSRLGCRPARRRPCLPEYCIESLDRCRVYGDPPNSERRRPDRPSVKR